MAYKTYKTLCYDCAYARFHTNTAKTKKTTTDYTGHCVKDLELKVESINVPACVTNEVKRHYITALSRFPYEILFNHRPCLHKVKKPKEKK